MTVSALTETVAAPGQVDTAPRIVRVDCDNTLAEVTTTGFLNAEPLYSEQGALRPSDFVFVNYQDGQGIFTPTLDPIGIVTLSAQAGTVAFTGASVVGNTPSFDSTTGGMQDSGLAVSDIQLKTNLKAASVPYSGGATSFGISVPGLTTNSIVVVSFVAKTNPSTILAADAQANSIQITVSADPGSCILNYIAFVAAQ